MKAESLVNGISIVDHVAMRQISADGHPEASVSHQAARETQQTGESSAERTGAQLRLGNIRLRRTLQDP